MTYQQLLDELLRLEATELTQSVKIVVEELGMKDKLVGKIVSLDDDGEKGVVIRINAAPKAPTY